MTLNLSDAAIVCKDVQKSYLTPEGLFDVVQNFSLSIKNNEFVALFGPGQCGKTVLLNILSGLEAPSSGEVIAFGEKVEGPSPKRGVVFQNIALFPWLTVRENVAYGLKMRGVPKNIYEAKAAHYIDLVGLSGFEDAYPIKLSGGMKQRVGIARAYCICPQALFMDEPFGALDAQTRYLMQQELHRIVQEEKRTTVFVTNNIEEALYLADRIIVLNNCPTSIKADYKIDLPHPRSYVSAEFLRLRLDISALVDKTR